MGVQQYGKSVRTKYGTSKALFSFWLLTDFLSSWYFNLVDIQLDFILYYCILKSGLSLILLRHKEWTNERMNEWVLTCTSVVVCLRRLMQFNDEWPKLEKWFDELSVLKQVDASAGHDDVAGGVEDIIQQCLVMDEPQVHTHTHTHTHAYVRWQGAVAVKVTWYFNCVC